MQHDISFCYTAPAKRGRQIPLSENFEIQDMQKPITLCLNFLVPLMHVWPDVSATGTAHHARVPASRVVDKLVHLDPSCELPTSALNNLAPECSAELPLDDSRGAGLAASKELFWQDAPSVAHFACPPAFDRPLDFSHGVDQAAVEELPPVCRDAPGVAHSKSILEFPGVAVAFEDVSHGVDQAAVEELPPVCRDAPGTFKIHT
jgi:hypothetical protein